MSDTNDPDAERMAKAMGWPLDIRGTRAGKVFTGEMAALFFSHEEIATLLSWHDCAQAANDLAEALKADCACECCDQLATLLSADDEGRTIATCEQHRNKGYSAYPPESHNEKAQQTLARWSALKGEADAK